MSLKYSTKIFAQGTQNLFELRESISIDYFETKKSIRNLPRTIKKHLKKNGIKFRKKYKKILKTEYDAVYRIPSMIAISERYCLINYSHTGRAFHVHTLVLKIKDGEVTDSIGLYTPEFAKISNLKYYFSLDEIDISISNEY